MSLKETIQEIAAELGFQRTVIAGLQPMPDARKHFEEWLAAGYAGSMDYLKRDPAFRTSPQLLLPEALSAIIVSVSYFTPPPESPGREWGRVAAYAVGLDYHVVLRARLKLLKERLEKAVGRPILSRSLTDSAPLYERAFAQRSGLGFSGKNTLIIGPKLSGSYNFIAELFTDLPLEPDVPFRGTCGECFRCAAACPTDAIVAPETLDARLCISYLTIENKDEIPVELRSKLGCWVFGCDVCQVVCPYNQRPPETPWDEFRPHRGVGHYINLYDLLEIETQEEFHQRFIRTPLRRPKRRGLLRNALVVLGNQRPDDGAERIFRFASQEPDPMLRQHAAWALSQYEDSAAAHLLRRLASIA